MKKILLTIIILFASCAIAHQEEYFLRGNKYYQERNFNDALASYQKIEHKGPAVLFNMGNCFFNLGNDGQAIAHWLKADNQEAWKIHQKVDQNCSIAYKKLDAEYSKSSLDVFYCSFVRLLRALPLLWWQLLFLCVWIFSIIAIVHAIEGRRWWRVILIFVLVCGIMICFVIRYKSASCTYALVVEKETAVRTGPSDNYGVVAIANYLDTIEIDRRRDNWLMVHNKRCKGWICANNVAIIDNKL